MYDRSIFDSVYRQVIPGRDVCRTSAMITYSYLTEDRKALLNEHAGAPAMDDTEFPPTVIVGDERPSQWEEDE